MDRYAAQFGDRGTQGRRVAVIHLTRPDRGAGGHQLVAGRQHGDPGTTPDVGRAHTDGGQHTDFPRRQRPALTQDGVAPRHVGTRAGDGGAGGDGCRAMQQAVLQAGVFLHQHGVGAAGDHTAGRDHGGRAGLDGLQRLDTGGQRFGVQAQHRPVGAAYRKAVHARAIEARYVDGGDHVFRQHPAQ